MNCNDEEQYSFFNQSTPPTQNHNIYTHLNQKGTIPFNQVPDVSPLLLFKRLSLPLNVLFLIMSLQCYQIMCCFCRTHCSTITQPGALMAIDAAWGTTHTCSHLDTPTCTQTHTHTLPGNVDKNVMEGFNWKVFLQQE